MSDLLKKSSKSKNGKSLIKKINKSVSNQIDKVFEKKKKRGKYMKLQDEKKEILMIHFKMNPYPKRIEYLKLAQDLEESVSKVENWFKHERRLQLENDKIKCHYKKRRLLKNEEEEILEESFRRNPIPNSKEMSILAKSLNFKLKVVSNWFSYRRGKLFKVTNQEYREKNTSISISIPKSAIDMKEEINSVHNEESKNTNIQKINLKKIEIPKITEKIENIQKFTLNKEEIKNFVKNEVKNELETIQTPNYINPSVINFNQNIMNPNFLGVNPINFNRFLQSTPFYNMNYQNPFANNGMFFNNQLNINNLNYNQKNQFSFIQKYNVFNQNYNNNNSLGEYYWHH